MKKTVEKLENCKTKATITFEEKEWKDAQEVAFKKLAEKVEIKGFRKGKAPESLVRSHVNPQEVLEHALDSLLQEGYRKVLVEDKIEPFARPEVSVTKMSADECEVVITIVTRPEVTLGEYKNLGLKHEEIVVNDEEVVEEIAKRLKDNSELVLKEDESKLGDTVVIDFEGFVDGKAFEGGKASNYTLELGSNTFIPGFEDQLVGVKSEEERDVKVTFPSEYPAKELAGKEAVFKVKVHEIKEKVVPELNDEFVADLNIKDVKTVEEYRNFVREDLRKTHAQEEENRFFNEMLKVIRENSKVVIPDEMVEEEVEAMYGNLQKQVEQNGLTMEQYYELSKQSIDDVKARMKEEAIVNIQNFFILEEVGNKEEIEVNDAIIDFEIQKMAQTYNMEPDAVKEIVLKDKARFVENIRRDQICKLLLKSNE